MTTGLVATPGVLSLNNLKSRENWRAALHQAVLVAVPALVTLNLVTQNDAATMLPFVLGIVDSLLSAGNTIDRLRKTIYAVVALLQAGGLLVRLLTEFAPDYVIIGSAVLAVVSAFMARFYVPTTTITPTTTAPQVAIPGAYRNPWRKPSQA